MRIEELPELLVEPLTDPEPILETLVNAMARGQSHPEAWDSLHGAALRDGKVVELATAYQNVLGDKRVKLLPPDQHIALHLYAARVFGTMLGETNRIGVSR